MIATSASVAPRTHAAYVKHGRHAVAVLLGDPEWTLADHQIPADRGVARAIGAAKPKSQAFQALMPVFGQLPQMTNGGAAGVEEQVVMVDPSASFEVLMKRELAFQH